jgi:arylsulfatase A-like enzyme
MWVNRLIRIVLGFSLLAAHPVSVSEGRQAKEEGWRDLTAEKPSIVIVLVDALRTDYLGCYGFSGEISPTVDQIANDSLTFTRAFSQAPWTKPSGASLMTSLHPQSHGVRRTGRRSRGLRPTIGVLKPDVDTLAETLHGAGYQTAAFVANPWVVVKYGFDQGFETFEQTGLQGDYLLQRATAWLKARDASRPFFLYLHLMEVHGPYDAPYEDYLAMRRVPELNSDRQLSPRQVKYLDSPQLHWPDPEQKTQLSSWKARYAAGVREMDRYLASFVAEPPMKSLLPESIFVFTSDHGEEFLEHGNLGHGRGLCDHQLRIPLLMRLPKKYGRGRSIDNVVNLIDLMPTLLRAAGLEAPPYVQGRDLSPLIFSEETGTAPGIAYSTCMMKNPDLHSVRVTDYKLIKDVREGTFEFFDLARDPQEQEAVSEPAELIQQLEERLSAFLSGAVDMTLDVESEVDTPEVIERLKALGYGD